MQLDLCALSMVLFLLSLVTLALAGASTPIAGAQPMPITSWAGKRGVVVVAHPDDAEGMAGGTIAAATAAGADVSYVVITNGDAGGQCWSLPDGFNCSRVATAQERINEQLAAAAFLNVSTVRFGDFHDGGLVGVPDGELRYFLTVVLRSLRPDVVLSWFPLAYLGQRPNAAAYPECYGGAVSISL